MCRAVLPLAAVTSIEVHGLAVPAGGPSPGFDDDVAPVGCDELSDDGEEGYEDPWAGESWAEEPGG